MNQFEATSLKTPEAPEALPVVEGKQSPEVVRLPEEERQSEDRIFDVVGDNAELIPVAEALIDACGSDVDEDKVLELLNVVKDDWRLREVVTAMRGTEFGLEHIKHWIEVFVKHREEAQKFAQENPQYQEYYDELLRTKGNYWFVAESLRARKDIDEFVAQYPEAQQHIDDFLNMLKEQKFWADDPDFHQSALHYAKLKIDIAQIIQKHSDKIPDLNKIYDEFRDKIQSIDYRGESLDVLSRYLRRRLEAEEVIEKHPNLRTFFEERFPLLLVSQDMINLDDLVKVEELKKKHPEKAEEIAQMMDEKATNSFTLSHALRQVLEQFDDKSSQSDE